MSDLISRQVLIDDVFKLKCLTKKSKEWLAEIIRQQPTAYDVNKVVKNIGKISEPVRPVGWSRKIEIVCTKDVVEIVKAGGVNE